MMAAFRKDRTLRDADSDMALLHEEFNATRFTSTKVRWPSGLTL